MTTLKKFGKYPMKESQWEKMVEVVGALCHKYNIAVSDKTVLGHGEVQRKLGKPQSGKIDPMVLPWDMAKTFDQVGDMFRYRVQFYTKYGF